MTIIFWFCIFLVFFTYVLYPIILLLITKAFKTRSVQSLGSLPSVTMLIAAYNEERVIEKKLENCLSLDYPGDLLQIIVASDGSDDNTNVIVEKFSLKHKSIKLISCPRIGKALVINEAMQNIDSELVIFSDANTEYEKNAIEELSKYFFDERTGCVCGRLIYRNPGEIVSGKGESFYWRYETNLKILESRLGYVAGANGAIYAIRRKLFEPLPVGTINDDFTISMNIVKKGFKCLYEENALAYEYVAPAIVGEFWRHVRDGAGHYIAIGHLLGLLNPFLGIRAFIYWSHRILRWLVPFMLILLLAVNIFLAGIKFYQYVLFLQVLFYALAVGGLLLVKYKRIPFVIYAPFYFCNLNLALFMGFLKAVFGKQGSAWERTERSI